MTDIFWGYDSPSCSSPSKVHPLRTPIWFVAQIISHAASLSMTSIYHVGSLPPTPYLFLSKLLVASLLSIWRLRWFTPKFPLQTPPEGMASNFINPPSLEKAIVIVSATMIILSLFFVSIRLISNSTSSRKLGWDDGSVVT